MTCGATASEVTTLWCDGSAYIIIPVSIIINYVDKQVSSVLLSECVVKCEVCCVQDEVSSLELLNVLKKQPMTLQVLQVTRHVQTF